MDKLSDFALERATRGYTSYASGDDVLKLIKTAQSLDPQGRNAVMKGIVGAWNPKRKETAIDEGENIAGFCQRRHSGRFEQRGSPHSWNLTA